MVERGEACEVGWLALSQEKFKSFGWSWRRLSSLNQSRGQGSAMIRDKGSQLSSTKVNNCILKRLLMVEVFSWSLKFIDHTYLGQLMLCVVFVVTSSRHVDISVVWCGPSTVMHSDFPWLLGCII